MWTGDGQRGGPLTSRSSPVRPDVEHALDSSWRDAEASALELRVVQIQNWLAHTDELVAMFGMHSDEQVAQVLRSAAGLLKERRNRLAEDARALRTAETDG
jgi:hypothetical protein